MLKHLKCIARKNVILLLKHYWLWTYYIPHIQEKYIVQMSVFSPLAFKQYLIAILRLFLRQKKTIINENSFNYNKPVKLSNLQKSQNVKRCAVYQ